MYQLETINQGNSSFLVLWTTDKNKIDELAIGMFRNNRVEGLLPVTKRWEKDHFSLYYEISSLTPLSHCYEKLTSENRLRTFLTSYCRMMMECDEYLLEREKLLMEDTHVYVRVFTGEVFFPYIALEEPEEKADPAAFLDSFIHKIVPLLPSDSSLRPILYEQSFLGKVNPETLLKALEEPEKEKTCSVAPTAKSEHTQEPAPIESIKEIANWKEERDRPVSIATIPKPEEDKKEHCKFEILPKTMAETSKKKAKDITTSASDALAQCNIENPFMVGALTSKKNNEIKPAKQKESSKKSKVGIKSIFEKKRSENMADSAKMQEEKNFVEVRPIDQSILQIPPKKTKSEPSGEGYTVNVKKMDSGAQNVTVRMDSDLDRNNGNSVHLWLVRRDDGQRVQITHSNFHVGRMQGRDEIVDYAVMTATGFLGSDHAYFEFCDDELTISDNNSTNGTWLNGKKLEPSRQYTVHNGDIIKMADIEFFVSN